MRVNRPVNQREVKYQAEQRLVSTTDVKGVITSVNSEFLDVSGYSEEELLGEAHNIIRHPDMPQPAFEELWQTLKRGDAWLGMVKNRCKNGDFYWVDAFVTPIFSGGKVTGYQSVRRKPSETHVERANKIYSGTQSFGERVAHRIRSLKLKTQVLLAVLSPALLVALMADFNLIQWAVLIPAIVLLGFLSAAWVSAPWAALMKESTTGLNSSIARNIYGGRDNELGQMKTLIHFYEAQKETILWRLKEVAEEVSDSAELTETITRRSADEMDNLNREVEQVATSMHQMSATVQEVAKNAALTANATESAKINADAGSGNVQSTQKNVLELAAQVENSTDVVRRLAKDSEQIGEIVDVISSIADQTNLLALNAAIEAARAGEQGRGFAVVADEVRTLAGRTQSSTGEIQAMVDSLQGAAATAVSALEASSQVVDLCVEHSSEAESSLQTILNSMNEISGMSLQIATATEEQSAVSEEINRNVANINDAGAVTLKESRSATESSTNLAGAAHSLKELVLQFTA